MESIKTVLKRLSMGSILLFIGFLIISVNPCHAKDVDLGVSVNDGKISNFYFSLSDHYRIPVEEIFVIKKKAHFIVEEELPLFFLIVKEARVNPDIVISLRKEGLSWHDIMVRFGIRPERVFERYIIVGGPPYGRAWGYYKNHPGRVIVFHDRDIVELSNIKFLSEYYYKKPEIVVDYKRKYPKYIDVHHVFYREKRNNHEYEHRYHNKHQNKHEHFHEYHKR